MAANKVTIGRGLSVERTYVGRSPIIWGSFWDQVREDNSDGELFFENFLCWGGTAVASKSGNYSGTGSSWHSFEDTSCSIKESFTDNPNLPGAAGIASGVIKMAVAATAHINVAMELGATANAVGSSVGGPFGVGSNAAVTVPGGGALPKLYFETRLRFNTITANQQSAFFGFAVPNKTSGANTVFNGSDVLQTMNHIGFYIDGSTGGGSPVITGGSASKIFGTYGISGTAPTVVTTTPGGVPSATAYTGQTTTPGLLTDFTKLGLVFDPTAVNALSYYQDGQLIGSQTLAQITAANWPSNVPLTLLFYYQTPSGTALSLDVDWAAAAQILATE